ncbi:hypothetical protein Bbelb_356370 [Branchiostoma belcheri]|nr:hypothetical protein Bbelb_356370 [Branchiostoma belcheri]
MATSRQGKVRGKLATKHNDTVYGLHCTGSSQLTVPTSTSKENMPPPFVLAMLLQMARPACGQAHPADSVWSVLPTDSQADRPTKIIRSPKKPAMCVQVRATNPHAETGRSREHHGLSAMEGHVASENTCLVLTWDGNFP